MNFDFEINSSTDESMRESLKLLEEYYKFQNNFENTGQQKNKVKHKV